MIELAEETARTYCAKLLAKNFFARRMHRELRDTQAELMRQVRLRPMGARSRGISTASHRVSPRQMREDKLVSEAELERREMRAVMAMGDEASRDTPDKLRGNAPSVAKENGVHHRCRRRRGRFRWCAKRRRRGRLRLLLRRHLPIDL